MNIVSRTSFNGMEIPQPIVKWAGGKRFLLPELVKKSPNEFSSYYEPFLGGGAFYFTLFGLGKIKEAVLSDLNSDLIWLYTVIRNNVSEFVEVFNEGGFASNKETFYRIRTEFNNAKAKGERTTMQAARLLYLNKTCFNGLYRVNRAGNFNVPFGGYKNPTFFERENLEKVSRALRVADLMSVDFEKAVADAPSKAFIYLDPPYAPVSETSDFTAYTKAGFSFEEQQRLSRIFSELHERGCFVMESNSAASEIAELYNQFNIETVESTRAISADGSKRGRIKEFLIRNFTTPEDQEEPSEAVQTTLSDFY